MVEVKKQLIDGYKAVSNISDSIVAFLKNCANIFLDVIINGIKFKKSNEASYEYKYYKYINITLALLLFGLVYFLNDYYNLFGVKNTQYEILGILLLISVVILYFLFLVFRNNNNSIINKDERLNINSGDEKNNKFLNDSSYYQEVYTINSEKIKNTYVKPLTLLFMYSVLLFITLVSILLIINYVLYAQKNSNSFSITQSVLGVTIVVVVLAIIAALFSIKSSSSNSDECINDDTSFLIYNYICIIKKVIFFIPCALVIVVDEFNKDVKLTPSSIYLLLFILLFLITLLFITPVLFNYFRTLNKSDLLKGDGPYYLNKKKVIGIYQNLNKNINSTIDIPIQKNNDTNASLVKNPIDTLLNSLSLKNVENTIFTSVDSSTLIGDEDKNITKQTEENISDTKGFTFKLLKNDYNDIYNIKTQFFDPPKTANKFPYNYSYSISFYIYINPQSTNTSPAYAKDTELFNYAYKPVIYYNGKSQSVIIRSRTLNNKGDQLDTIYEEKNVKFQKWVFFVINYDNNIIDIFMNGKLVGSKKDVTPYFKGDKVTIGEDEGIYGSIKDITYYDSIKSPQTIELLYHLTKNK
jgi:hypothetical protein